MTPAEFATTFIAIFSDYFGSPAVSYGILITIAALVSLFAVFLSTKNSRFRSNLLVAILCISSSFWVFILSSLVFCTALLPSYWQAQDRTVAAVFAFSLLSTSVFAPLGILSLRVRAAKYLSSFFSKTKTELSSDGVRAESVFSKLNGRILSSSAQLNILQSGEGEPPLSAAFEWRGKQVVAVTESVAHSLDDDELETVLAHEIAHLSGRDSAYKTVATAYRMGFLFDPISRFVEAALYREREYLADEFSATVTGKPESLASALLKIYELGRRSTPILRIPSFSSISLRRDQAGMLSKQPELKRRVERLLSMSEKRRLERQAG